MKKLVVTSVSALALLGLAACSDSADTTTTQSVPDTTTTEPAPMEPATPPAAVPAPAQPAPAQ
jgi:ABC-type oligopeptide transport system substrate-binding subunit